MFPPRILCISIGLLVHAGAEFDREVGPFLRAHCVECHGAEEREGGVRFDGIGGFEVADTELWTAVHEVLSSGEMPPEKVEARPAGDSIDAVVAWIEREQRGATEGGIRRLNRREANAALRDLTGLGVDFGGGLPEDATVGGFDTGAAALGDAEDSVEAWLDVSRRAVEGIRFTEPEREAAGVEFDLLDEKFKDARRAFDPYEERGVLSRGKGAVWREGCGLLLQAKWLGDRDAFTIVVPAPEDRRGVVRVEVEVSPYLPVRGVPEPRLAVEIGGKGLPVLAIGWKQGETRTLVFEESAEDLALGGDGLLIELKNLVEMPYGVEGFDNEDKTKPEQVPGGGGLFRPVYDRKAPPEEQPVPFIAVRRLAVCWDHVAAWPPEGWGIAAAREGAGDAEAERLLRVWAGRAWRRPAAGGELGPFRELYRRGRRDGMGFDPALRSAFQAVLLSAPFRYLPPAADGDHALAARLGFMLTGAPPDAELRELAERGRLRDAEVLRGQVRRLLRAGGREGFFAPFVSGWLELGQPITLAMDYFGKQDFRFGRYLKESMRAETVAYVAELFAADRPARELVRSDWTMMNDALAQHYGYAGIGGAELRRVELRGDDPRGGGVFGHAGVQSMLTWMGDNWVIYRGAWALRTVLDDPPPPPPLEVPELDPGAGENRGKPFRELLLQHQAEAGCAVCHRSIDPLGFAFQNFDLSGRWREFEFERYIRNELDGKVEWRGEGRKRPVDATGVLPDGAEFASFDELKEILADDHAERIALGVLKRLTLFGTGRQADVADLRALREILDRHRAKGFPLRSMLEDLVASEVFGARPTP